MDADLLSRLTTLYRDLHQHPELSSQEHRTAGIVAQWLTDLGLEVIEGIGGTGVVGILRNGPGGTVLMRADLDALPVTEDTALPYASTVDGVMHACGHDVHVTCLLGAATTLDAVRDTWAGTLVFVFQPAEVEPMESAPAVVNDPAAAERTRAALEEVVGVGRVVDPGPVTGSEDVGVLAAAAGAPLVFWLLGGADPAAFAGASTPEELMRAVAGLPSNHSPHYAPVEHPTLDLGVAALTAAATAWLVGSRAFCRGCGSLTCTLTGRCPAGVVINSSESADEGRRVRTMMLLPAIRRG